MSGKYIKFGTKRDKISSNKEETNLAEFNLQMQQNSD